MKSIIYVGMDVHSTSFTLSCYSLSTQETFATLKIEPTAKAVKKYLEGISRARNEECVFVCGYEAGCLGYTLYHHLTAMDIKCIIIAPTTIMRKPNEIKTDRRDAEKLALALAYGNYSTVYVPNAQDDAVKEYIRMRDDHKLMLKKNKQQILAFCLRHDRSYSGTRWTQAHLKWLNSQTFEGYLQNVLEEYLITYRQLTDKIERLDAQIKQFSELDDYRDKVKKLICIKGIKEHTALSLIVETGDFSRFESAQKYASYLGLVPGERSSSDRQQRLSITKAGNRHLRLLLVEASQCYGRGRIGYKSKALKARQAGASPEVISYADKASNRMSRKYSKMIFHSKKHNVAKTAVARELACFIWGMMTEHII